MLKHTHILTQLADLTQTLTTTLLQLNRTQQGPENMAGWDVMLLVQKLEPSMINDPDWLRCWREVVCSVAVVAPYL